MFGKNTKVDLELNREVEQLLKTGGKERILPIVQAGEPVLRQQTVQYSGQLSKGTLNKLIDTMHTTMLEAPGVGLAATQIGLGLALAVVEDHVRDDEDDPREIAEFPFHVIINPSYEPIGDATRSFYEGCLSFADQAEQQVFGADVVVLESTRLFLRQHDHAPCTVGKPFEHACPSISIVHTTLPIRDDVYAFPRDNCAHNAMKNDMLNITCQDRKSVV